MVRISYDTNMKVLIQLFLILLWEYDWFYDYNKTIISFSAEIMELVDIILRIQTIARKIRYRKTVIE